MEKEYEVAVAYTDKTWDSIFIAVPVEVYPEMSQEYAEEEALKRMCGDGRSEVAFVKVIWESTEEDTKEWKFPTIVREEVS